MRGIMYNRLLIVCVMSLKLVLLTGIIQSDTQENCCTYVCGDMSSTCSLRLCVRMCTHNILQVGKDRQV